ncbi:archaeal proteasome endopeptidase complex subunit alpha [Salinilacihabitans rarus]|uniref:archaeal proteasome endopeptidase complex subunit alpha n=1 Tax=Salinilacihabitans rarus TaxID=2961596 RepID=UPI0020C8A345|nr:archaeal proteasome endopeptidase complex subunit alpha [Salinilacihabitans rarus]
MDGNARQQAYDRGHTIFSPDGRLYQVEYARQAVERGSPSVGIRTGEGVVLAARKRLRSPLLEAGSVEKIHAVDDHVAVASAGHAADARRLVDVARRAGQRHRLRYGEPIGVEPLATAVADHVQEHTQSGGARPYGAALLVAGVDPAPDGDARDAAGPFEVDPSGAPYGWRATAIGDGAGDLRGLLEDRVGDDPPAALDEGVDLALEALASTAAEPLAPADVDVRVLADDGGTTAMADDDLAARLAG